MQKIILMFLCFMFPLFGFIYYIFSSEDSNRNLYLKISFVSLLLRFILAIMLPIFGLSLSFIILNLVHNFGY
ncbi:diguanylate cyclase/phosphodiesterase domain 1 [Peptoniphilus indolicus ATCC 29427]|uniref:Diguanylate cyclase/phosphodiesterase domain 1 n=1 Tax=Peptoniphilus indolicus ATCC 29427 TaxID=997350 RepID=G4D3T4_9FIRM|nr:diguanylate cyclase/phosphodiesterase domain 1 [Peptoniphilus indolicus ATCC 29427]